jgi:hypothetical protein
VTDASHCAAEDRSETSRAGPARIAPDRIEAEILRLAGERGEDQSICPSEVARALAADASDWHSLMAPVRRGAVRLAVGGRIDILRKGKPVDAAQEIRGVIRLRIRPRLPAGADPSGSAS